MVKLADNSVGRYTPLEPALRGSILGTTLLLAVSACATETTVPKQVPDVQSKEVRSAHAPSFQTLQRMRETLNDSEQKELDKASAKIEPLLISRNEKIASLEMDFTGFGESLLNLGMDEIKELLGIPAFQRVDPPAQIWQYRTTACIVDIFFYENMGQLTVEYVETRERKVSSVDERFCFGSVVQK